MCAGSGGSSGGDLVSKNPPKCSSILKSTVVVKPAHSQVQGVGLYFRFLAAA